MNNTPFITGRMKINDNEFRLFRTLMYKKSGVSLSDEKHSLVESRLVKRLIKRQVESFSDYYLLIMEEHEKAELQCAIELLTTNETYFFREQTQLDYFANDILPLFVGRHINVWSAACSYGQEVYSLAMLLHESLGIAPLMCSGGKPWSLLGSDLSSRVLSVAEQGVYAIDEASKIPKRLLKRYCLKGHDQYADSMMVDKQLRKFVKFKQLNLMDRIAFENKFDVIFLRNVLIYFDRETVKKIIANMYEHLSDEGWLIVGHAESLHGLTNRFRAVKPSIYRKLL